MTVKDPGASATRRKKAEVHAGPKDSRNEGVQVIRRASQILHALGENPAGLSLSQLSTTTHLARSTVHRLITGLAEEGLVTSAGPRSRFRLGPAISTLGRASEASVIADFHPQLARLGGELNETVDLSVLEHTSVRFVDQVAGTQRLRASSSIGGLLPAHATAPGKALLAMLPENEFEALMPPKLEAYTPHTVTDRDKLAEELELIRTRKIAYDLEESTVGISAVGLALGDGLGNYIAISVPMPQQRFAAQKEKVVDALLKVQRGGRSRRHS